MPPTRRSTDWGFPRWRAYGESDRAPDTQRRCDRDGCDQPGLCPAPKAPNHPERWWFCERHAAEYNKGWDYFAALSKEEAARQQAGEEAEARGWERARHWAWGDGDGSRSRGELDALAVFELAPDADMAAIKQAWRQLAKDNHPDVRPGDPDAARRFQAGQAAYEVLRLAAARREALSSGQQ